MKSYLLAHWQAFAVYGLILVLGVLYGCATLAERPATARLVVTYAVGKYVEAAVQPAERAQRVTAVAVNVLALADSTQTLTVDLLKAAALSQLPANLSPADKAMAGAVIDAAVEALRTSIKTGDIPPDQLLTVKSVIQWVIDGAAPYLPKP